MKKLIVLAFAAMLCLACSTEEETTSNEGTNLEVVLENYKGVFTTADGLTRGSLDVTLSEDKLSATADLTLSTGEIIMINTDQIIDLGNRKELTFNANDLSFVMTTGEEGEIMEVNTVTFRGNESAILVGQSTNRAPLEPIAGSYSCLDCPAPLDSSLTQTFNILVGAADGSGNSVVASQTTLGGTIYNGIATQSGCVVNGDQTTCNLNSGVIPGSTGTAFNPGGGPVTWSGTHTFDNGPSGPDNCSTVSGTWTWSSSTIGTVGGNFISNPSGDCAPPPVTIVFEDFEDATVAYTLRDESNNLPLSEDISESMQEDYFGRIAIANLDPADALGFVDFVGTRFFGANDYDSINSFGAPDDGNPTTDEATRLASINWNNIDVSAYSNVSVSALFAEGAAADGNEDWDRVGNACLVRVQYSFNNGASWNNVYSIIGEIAGSSNTRPVLDANNDGTPDTPIVEIDESFDELSGSFATGGNPTVSIRIYMEHLTGTDEDIAFDNVTISGN